MKRLGLVTLVLALGCGESSSNNVGPTGPTGGYADSGQRDGGLDGGHDGNGQKPDANSRQDGRHDGNGIRDSGRDASQSDSGSRDSGQEDGGWDSSGSFDAQYVDASDGSSGQPDANDFDGGRDSGPRDGSLDASVLNHYPTVELSASKTTADRNEDIAFTANGQDSDGDPLQYEFYTNEGQRTSPNTRNNTIFAFTNYGTFSVGVNVDDRRGGTNSDSLDVLIENPNRLFVEAGPDMTLDRDKDYCVNFGCNATFLDRMCGREPFAPGHSAEGFQQSGSINYWYFHMDYERFPGWGWRNAKCGVLFYESNSVDYNYQTGDIVILRLEGSENSDFSEGHTAFDEATIILR